MEITNRKKTIFLLILIATALIMMFYINNITVYASSVSTSAQFLDKFKAFFKEYKVILSGVMGFGLLTSIAIFIYHFCRLSATASNPQKRAEVINNLLITGLCTALLGAVPLIVILLFNITKWE